MFELPTSILIKDKYYPIRNKGDYRLIEDCFIALNDKELTSEYKIVTCLILFYESLNSIDDIYDEFDDETLSLAVKEMFNFFNCGSEDIGAKKPYKLIDWKKDEQLIVSSINAVAYQEIRSVPYIHWWTFMGYFMNIGDCLLSNIVNIREKIVKGTKLEKHEKQFRSENPQYFNWERRTDEQIADDELLLELWED